MQSNITIDGGSSKFTIDGVGSYKGFSIDDQWVPAEGRRRQRYIVLQNLVLTQMFRPSENRSIGAAIRWHQSHMELNNVTIRDSTAAHGGAIAFDVGGGNYTSRVLIRNSRFENNTASLTYWGGGALYDDDTFAGTNSRVTVTIRGSQFTNNSAPNLLTDNSLWGGGAFYLNDGIVTYDISDSVFRGNSSANRGGAIYVYVGAMTIDRSLFENNSAKEGGGVRTNGNDPVAINNSTFSGNSATDDGGGFYGFETTLRNNTFVGNSAGDGGGVYLRVSSLDQDNSIYNNIIYGNSASGTDADDRADCAGQQNSLSGGNIIGGGECGGLDADPLLGGLTSHGSGQRYYPLRAGSPAVEMGLQAQCDLLTTDQLGRPRPQPAGTLCDIGAVEFVPSTTSQSARSSGARSAGELAEQGSSSCELLERQGYRLFASYGLSSGVQCQRVGPPGIGAQSVLDQGFLDAIDVWSYVEQGVEVCFPQLADIVFLDAATSPRTIRTIPFSHEDGFTCVELATTGTLVLVASTPADPSSSDEPQLLTGCWITTTDFLKMRDGPGGDRVLLVIVNDATLYATRRTTGWFEVSIEGATGWVSADYVTPQGTCDA